MDRRAMLKALCGLPAVPVVAAAGSHGLFTITITSESILSAADRAALGHAWDQSVQALICPDRRVMLAGSRGQVLNRHSLRLQPVGTVENS